MCRCLKVSRSGCYAWLGREPSRTVRRRKELSALIEWVFNSSRATLRAAAVLTPPWPAEALRRARRRCAPSCAPRAWWPHSHAERTGRHCPGRRVRGSCPDLVRRNFTANRPGVRWVGDIHLYPHLGGTRSAWRPSPAAARRKQSGTRWRTARGTGPDVRGDRYGGPQVPVHDRRDDLPLGPGVPVHLRAVRPASGEI